MLPSFSLPHDQTQIPYGVTFSRIDTIGTVDFGLHILKYIIRDVCAVAIDRHPDTRECAANPVTLYNCSVPRITPEFIGAGQPDSVPILEYIATHKNILLQICRRPVAQQKQTVFRPISTGICVLEHPQTVKIGVVRKSVGAE